MANPTLSLGGMTAEKVFQEAVANGLSQVDAAVLVSGWIFENFGKSQRVFGYKQTFAEEDPACQAQFIRSFEHVDWIDGESVVQAETTAGESGFNFRFHRIEGDFEAVKADLQKAFECVAEQRRTLHARFEELKAEINRINADVHNCCHRPSGPTAVGPIGPIGPFEGLANTGLFLGNVKFNEKYVALWQTKQGYMMLPTVYTVATDFIADPRVQRAGYVARFAAENRDIARMFQEGPVKKDALVEKFGDRILGNGETLRTNLTILPDSATFRSTDELVDEIAEREALALRSRDGSASAVHDAFGLGVEFESVRDAPVEKFNILPPNARIALTRAGIDSIGKLAGASLQEIAGALRTEGVDIRAPDVAEWQATAKTLSRVR